MEIFQGLEDEKFILEIVRQVGIAIEMLRTSLTMSAGVSTFRTSFFPNRQVILTLRPRHL